MKVFLQPSDRRFYVFDKHLRIPIYEISIHAYSYDQENNYYVRYEIIVDENVQYFYSYGDV